jgi:hypothetical protein
MHRFALDVRVDLEELRERLRKMSDEQLLRFGRAAQYMCSPGPNGGKQPRESFVTQLGRRRSNGGAETR